MLFEFCPFAVLWAVAMAERAERADRAPGPPGERDKKDYLLRKPGRLLEITGFFQKYHNTF